MRTKKNAAIKHRFEGISAQVSITTYDSSLIW